MRNTTVVVVVAAPCSIIISADCLVLGQKFSNSLPLLVTAAILFFGGDLQLFCSLPQQWHSSFLFARLLNYHVKLVQALCLGPLQAGGLTASASTCIYNEQTNDHLEVPLRRLKPKL